MKKFLHSFLMLFVGISTVAFAQQEEASSVEAWNGDNLKLEMFAGDKLTYEYTATETGSLYIYVDDHDANDKLPLDIWGGWYHDGVYDADSPLQDTGDYDNGAGVYGWIRVFKDDVVRFTVTALETGEGQLTEFTLKSVFFNSEVGGNEWEKPIMLTLDQMVTIPPYPNHSSEILLGINDRNHVTFCKFTAGFNGVASIATAENVIYYLEEANLGNPETPFKSVSQDSENNNHEFVVTKGTDYLVVIPNIRPTEVTLKKTANRIGLSPKFPVEITSFPAELDLVKGNNYFAFSHELIGNTCMLEIAAAAGWNGTITYMEDPTENSTELAADKVAGAATFVKNVDPHFLYGNSVIMNFKVNDVSSIMKAAKLSLHEAKEGESFATAISAKLGENAIIGPAGDYWFSYTSEKDAEYSFTTSGTIKHVNFVAGVEQKVADNLYRASEGQTIYVCVTTTETNGTFTIAGEEILKGDYKDNPILFELGETITYSSRGKDCYYSFTAEDDGLAYFNSVNYSLYFYQEGKNGQLQPKHTRENGDDIKNTYELAVSAGHTYIVAIGTANGTIGETITVTTSFVVPVLGDVCETAVEINSLNDTIEIAYEFGKTKWFKITAEKSGFYSAYAKLGYNGYVGIKLGSCDAEEKHATSDNSHTNAYMGGYKVATEYVEAGQTLYINTRTGDENDEAQFGVDFYLVVAYTEARPGEAPAIAIKAEPYTDYTVMKNDEEGYEQWYVYTIPAGREVCISLTASVKYISNCLSFLKENQTSYLSKKSEYSDEYDYIQDNITDASGTTIGKRFDFAVIDTDRTFYIKVSTINALYFPVIWKIDGEDLNTNIIVEEVAGEAPVIYDLMGRRVENPAKGIYIINGVKRVIK